MEKEEMTIHRALAELKMIDAKIDKAIDSIDPTGVMQKDKLVNGLYIKADFEKDAKAKYQSVNDLIKRKNKIKSAIVKANGKTFVTIADKKMTIADAINLKASIEFNKKLISVILAKHNSIKAKFVLENEKINKVGLDNAKIMIGKQGDDSVKATDEDVKLMIDPFVKRNEYHLIDPLDVDNLVPELQDEVDEFEVNVDSALSEVNAITKIII